MWETKLIEGTQKWIIMNCELNKYLCLFGEDFNTTMNIDEVHVFDLYSKASDICEKMNFPAGIRIQ